MVVGTMVAGPMEVVDMSMMGMGEVEGKVVGAMTVEEMLEGMVEVEEREEIEERVGGSKVKKMVVVVKERGLGVRAEGTEMVVVVMAAMEVVQVMMETGGEVNTVAGVEEMEVDLEVDSQVEGRVEAGMDAVGLEVVVVSGVVDLVGVGG